MKNQVTKGLSQQAIVEEARKHGAKWVVVWTDHYRGNSKGYYQSVENFAKSNVFHWNDIPEDRGAVQVILTDEDVPAMVEQKTELGEQLRRMQLEYDRIEREAPAKEHIDGRWGKNNPIRIAALEANRIRRENIKNAQDAMHQRMEDVYNQMNRLFELVSVTMIELYI